MQDKEKSEDEKTEFPHLPKDKDGRFIFKLDEPIQFGSELIPELRMRKPKGKDMRGLSESLSFGDLMDVGGKLAAQPKSVIDEMAPGDVIRLVALVNGFLLNGQQTGTTA